MAIIPVSINGQQIDVKNEPEELTFKELNLKESHLEDFIRRNIGLLFGDEESLLIVGQQVIDAAGSRSDLVAIDEDGCLVLIEIKRDLSDIKSRAEAFESQAIRYAASLARIKAPRDLVEKLFTSYIAKHKNEEPFKSKLGALSEYELATRELSTFLLQNAIGSEFNQRQRIILIASEFDPVTLSSSAWLVQNGVDLSCYELKPLKMNDSHVVEFSRVMPLDKEEDFFIDIHSPQPIEVHIKVDKRTRRSLPRMATLFEWKLLKSGDALEIKNFPDSDAIVVDHKSVTHKGAKLSFNEWGQSVTGWSSICIYEWAVVKSAGKTLHDIRFQKLQEIEKQTKTAS